MRRLHYTDTARENLLAITRYIRLSSGHREIAKSFTVALRQQCAKMATLPGTIGRSRAQLRPNLRSFAFRGYVIYFQYLDEVLEIVAILEGHRDHAAVLGKDQD